MISGRSLTMCRITSGSLRGPLDTLEAELLREWEGEEPSDPGTRKRRTLVKTFCASFRDSKGRRAMERARGYRTSSVIRHSMSCCDCWGLASASGESISVVSLGILPFHISCPFDGVSCVPTYRSCPVGSASSGPGSWPTPRRAAIFRLS